MLVQFGQGPAQAQSQTQTRLQGQVAVRGKFASQSSRLIIRRIDVLAFVDIVGQLHDVVKITFLLIDAGVKHINKSFMRAGDGFKLPDAG